MNAETFCEHFATFADAPNGIVKLRELIFQLAVQGKLVPQDMGDEPASSLLTRVAVERHRRSDLGKLKSPTSMPPVECESLPNGWETVRLGSVIELISGQHLTAAEYNEDGQGHPYLTGPADFGDKHPVAKRWTNADRALARLNDILITVKGAGIGKTNTVATETVFISRQLMAVRPIVVDHEFIHLVLRSAYDQFQRQGVGIAIPGISREDVLFFKIWLPPLAEQRRIVEKVDQLLGLCDELAARQAVQREKRQRLVEATLDRLVSTRNPAEFPTHADRLRNHFDQLFDTPTTIPQLRQTILQLAVQGQLVPQDPNDEPVDALLANVHQRRRELVAEGTLAAIPKPVPLAEGEVETTIPEHWRWARLNDLVSVMDSGWSPACDEEPTTDESEWGVLKTTAVQTLYFNQGAHKRLPSGLQPRPAAEAKAGDLLITRAGPQNRVGISCLVKTVRPRLMISDKIIRFHLIEPFLFEEFIALCLNAGPSQAHLERAKSGMAASQMNISQAKFRMTPIPIPPLAEQNRIVTKVTKLLSLCDALEAKLTQAESASTQLLSAAVHHLLHNSPS